MSELGYYQGNTYCLTTMLDRLLVNKKTISTAMLAIFWVSAITAIVFAPNAQAANCGGTETSVITCDGEDNGVWGILLLVLQIMTAGVGVLAVGGIVYASVLWVTAEDKEAQVTQAKDIIRNVVIGLVAFALMYVGLQFLVPGGVFNRTYGFSTVKDATDQLPSVEDGAPSNPKPSSSDGDGSTTSKDKKATIRIGAYNAWSVTQTNSDDQVRRMSIGIDKMRRGGAEIVALQELSPSQTGYLRASPDWQVYRSDMGGNRGLGVAYRQGEFKLISSGDLKIPRDGTDQLEPFVTLERNKDKARITVMSVHLVALYYGDANYEKYQRLQQPVVRDKALQMRKDGNVVVVAGDFNWKFSNKKGYMGSMQYKGVGLNYFVIPADQKMSNFQSVDAGETSDHALIFVDAETNVFGK